MHLFLTTTRHIGLRESMAAASLSRLSTPTCFPSVNSALVRALDNGGSAIDSTYIRLYCLDIGPPGSLRFYMVAFHAFPQLEVPHLESQSASLRNSSLIAHGSRHLTTSAFGATFSRHLTKVLHDFGHGDSFRVDGLSSPRFLSPSLRKKLL